MKKLFISAVLATAMIFGANAQHFWVGGAVGFESSSFELETRPDYHKTSSFSVMPEIGFSLSNRFDIGLSGGFGTERHRFSVSGSSWGGPWRHSDDNRVRSWAIAPFVQYTALEFGRLRLLCRATVGFESHKGIMPTIGWDGVEFEHHDDARFSGFSANITPFVHFDISHRISLFTALNFVSVNFSRMTSELRGVEQNTMNSFNIGVDANNLLNVGALQFGFIFKF